MRLTERVYLLAGQVYGVDRNVYGIRGTEGLVVVDPGMNARDWAVAETQVRYWGLDALPVMDVLLTHEHFAHSANAALLQARGARVIANAAAAEALAAGDERVAHYKHAFEASFAKLSVDDIISGGEFLTRAGLHVQVVELPGHSRGSVAYLFRDGDKWVVFTGDTAIPQMLCMHGQTGWTGAVDYDRDQLLASLERLTQINADVVLAAHGEQCLWQGRQVLYDALVQARMALKHAASCTLKTD